MQYGQQIYPNYNPYGTPIQPQMPIMPQAQQASVQTPQVPQGQTIQTIDKPMDSQSFCYFVKSIEDMKAIKVIPGAYYIGINTSDNEIYVRKMKEDGTIGIEKYLLASDSHEKTPTELILERLDVIEEKLNAPIAPITDKSSWRKGDK